jgi:hypothetical protein
MDTGPAVTMDPDSKPHRRSRTDHASAEFQEQHGRAPPLRAKENLAADIAPARLRIMCRIQPNKVHILLSSDLCRLFALLPRRRRVKLRCYVMTLGCTVTCYYSSIGGIVNEIVGKN